MKSSIVVQDALRAATVRHVGPYQEIGKAFARLESIGEAADLFHEAAVLVGVYYDNPATVPAASLRSDAGVLVDPGVALPAGLAETMLHGGRYLHLRHVGSYAGLPAAWAYLRQHGLADHGVQRGEGPAFELYPNNPGNAAVGELITDIYVPVV
jgi:AraC family transcriptional regulator